MNAHSGVSIALSSLGKEQRSAVIFTETERARQSALKALLRKSLSPTRTYGPPAAIRRELDRPISPISFKQQARSAAKHGGNAARSPSAARLAALREAKTKHPQLTLFATAAQMKRR